MKLGLFLLTIIALAQVSQAFDFSSESLKEKAVSLLEMVLKRSPIVGNDSCTKSCCASLPARPAMTYRYYQDTGRFIGGSG